MNVIRYVDYDLKTHSRCVKTLKAFDNQEILMSTGGFKDFNGRELVDGDILQSPHFPELFYILKFGYYAGSNGEDGQRIEGLGFYLWRLTTNEIFPFSVAGVSELLAVGDIYTSSHVLRLAEKPYLCCKVNGFNNIELVEAEVKT